MAFDLKTFQTRLASALVFALLMMIGLLSNDWAFIVLFAFVNALCLREFIPIVEKITTLTFSKNEKVNFLVCGIILFAWVCTLRLHACPHSITRILEPFQFYVLGGFIGSLLIFLLFMKQKKSLFLLSGLGYISLSLGLLVQLRYQSLLSPLILILMIWMNDSMAYLCGSFWGRHKFFPAISPKKTWEGVVGGILFTLLLAILWGLNTNWFPLSTWISFGLIASILGTLGDLVESKLKRLAAIKDSGTLMPGHGGALDRFDSLIFTAPFAFLSGLVTETCFAYAVF